LLARYEYKLDGAGNRTVVTETVTPPAEGMASLWSQNGVAAAPFPISSHLTKLVFCDIFLTIN